MRITITPFQILWSDSDESFKKPMDNIFDWLLPAGSHIITSSYTLDSILHGKSYFSLSKDVML